MVPKFKWFFENELKVLIFVIALLFSGNVFSQNRVEQLFLWKMSDELKLNVMDERKFAKVFIETNQKKNKLTILINEQAEKLTQSKTDKDRLSAFQNYRKTLLEYNKLTIDEVDQMKGLLGLEKLSKYLAAKKDFTEKLKSLIVSGEKVEKEKEKPIFLDGTTNKNKKDLPPPKLIEE